MRHGLRRLFVCLFAVSFVFNGVAWAACIEMPVTPAAPIAASPDQHHAVAAGHGSHHHPDGGQTAAAPDQVPGSDHDHAPIIKCCSMAPVVSLAPNLSASSVNFVSTFISFRVGRHDLTGHIVALDPGIPKRIV